jgi:hypothetical protein
MEKLRNGKAGDLRLFLVFHSYIFRKLSYDIALTSQGK